MSPLKKLRNFCLFLIIISIAFLFSIFTLNNICIEKSVYELYNNNQSYLDTCNGTVCDFGNCYYYNCEKYDRIYSSSLMVKKFNLENCKKGD